METLSIKCSVCDIEMDTDEDRFTTSEEQGESLCSKCFTCSSFYDWWESIPMAD